MKSQTRRLSRKKTSFVSENYTRIRRRLCDYGDRLHGCIPKIKRTYQKKTKKEDGCDSPSSTMESISSPEENYHDAHEKWGKKDPECQNRIQNLGSSNNYQRYR